MFERQGRACGPAAVLVECVYMMCCCVCVVVSTMAEVSLGGCVKEGQLAFNTNPTDATDTLINTHTHIDTAASVNFTYTFCCLVIGNDNGE